MKRNRYLIQLLILIGIPFLIQPAADATDAAAVVKAAIDYYRGEASEATVKMVIHRPAWERSMTIHAWTRGQKDSLFYIIAPPKDKGNGTLKRGREMWTYNPKINRVIKLPPSMMSQSWMGSDFSNNDLAKSDSIIEDYVHTLAGTEIQEGKTVYLIKSMPKPEAPVIWGMQKLRIREDHILLAEEFYDEDLVLELEEDMPGLFRTDHDGLRVRHLGIDVIEQGRLVQGLLDAVAVAGGQGGTVLVGDQDGVDGVLGLDKLHQVLEFVGLDLEPHHLLAAVADEVKLFFGQLGVVER